MDDRPYSIAHSEKQDQPHKEITVTQEESKVAQTELPVAPLTKDAMQNDQSIDKTQLCIKNKHAELARLGVTVTYEIANNVELECGVSPD